MYIISKLRIVNIKKWDKNLKKSIKNLKIFHKKTCLKELGFLVTLGLIIASSHA